MTDTTEWQPIEFDEIRQGDRIRAVNGGLERVGVAQEHVNTLGWKNGGNFLAYESETVFLDPSSRPAEPEIPVGTAGTATVRGVEGVRVLRCGEVDTEPFWVSAYYAMRARMHPDEQVTDFVPDEILTDERVEQIRAEERERIAHLLDMGRFVTPFASFEGRDRIIAWLRGGAK